MAPSVPLKCYLAVICKFLYSALVMMYNGQILHPWITNNNPIACSSVFLLVLNYLFRNNWVSFFNLKKYIYLLFIHLLLFIWIFRCKSENDLRKHLETHSLVPSYKCPVEGCSYTTRSRTCYSTHYRKNHEVCVIYMPIKNVAVYLIIFLLLFSEYDLLIDRILIEIRQKNTKGVF